MFLPDNLWTNALQTGSVWRSSTSNINTHRTPSCCRPEYSFNLPLNVNSLLYLYTVLIMQDINLKYFLSSGFENLFNCFLSLWVFIGFYYGISYIVYFVWKRNFVIYKLITIRVMSNTCLKCGIAQICTYLMIFFFICCVIVLLAFSTNLIIITLEVKKRQIIKRCPNYLAVAVKKNFDKTLAFYW